MKMEFLKDSRKITAVLIAFVLFAAALVFETMNDHTVYINPSQIKPGDFVYFGLYPQSSLGTAVPATGTENINWVKAIDVKNNDELTYYAIEPIVWRVLENSGGELVLLSEKVLDSMPYNITLPSVAWENCTIRKWLNDLEENDSFINKAFNPAEKAAINPTTTAETDNNDITDQIFFLSLDEADRYFADNAGRIAYNTAYSAGAYYLHTDYWWLRTPPGGLDGYAAYVDNYGKVFSGGHHAFYTVGVRPALKLNLSSAAFTSGDGTLANPYSVVINPA